MGVARCDDVVPARCRGHGLAPVGNASGSAEAFGVNVRDTAQHHPDGVIGERSLALAELQAEVGEQADPGMRAPLPLQPEEKGEVLMMGRQRVGRKEHLFILQVAPHGIRRDQDVSELDFRNDDHSLAVLGHMHHDLPWRRAPHLLDQGAQAAGNLPVPFPVLLLGYEGHPIGLNASGQFAGSPAADVGGLARHEVGEPLVIRDVAVADVISARAQGREQGRERAGHIQEIVRVAAHIGLAAGLAPEGEHETLVGVFHAFERRPGEGTLHPPFDLFPHHFAAARNRSGDVRRNHHGLEYAFDLMGNDARFHARRQAARRFAVVLRGPGIKVERRQDGHAQPARLVDAGVHVGNVEVFSGEQNHIDEGLAIASERGQVRGAHKQQGKGIVSPALGFPDHRVDIVGGLSLVVGAVGNNADGQGVGVVPIALFAPGVPVKQRFGIVEQSVGVGVIKADAGILDRWRHGARARHGAAQHVHCQIGGESPVILHGAVTPVERDVGVLVQGHVAERGALRIEDQ